MISTWNQIRQDFSWSAVLTGFIAVVVSFAGPAVVVFQASSSAGFSIEQLSSWIWAISLGSGISGIVMSWKFKVPIITAWSTPGAALLVSSLPEFSFPEAIGAYLFCAISIALLGLTGLFETAMKRVPGTLAAAMLAGILLKFGLNVFLSLKTQPIFVGIMLGVYLFCKRLAPRYAIISTLIVGLLIESFAKQLSFGKVHLAFAQPIFTIPAFSWQSIVTLGIPLCIVTLASQNVPGLAVLRTAGYKNIATTSIISTTGLFSALFAPFGSHAINLAAITAAICTGSETHKKLEKRYIAGIFCGLFYILVGIFGATLATLFSSLPKELVATIAGLALFGSLMSSLHVAMENIEEREAALITFLVTVSDLSIFNIGSSFWGLIFGLVALFFLSNKNRFLLRIWNCFYPLTNEDRLSPTKESKTFLEIEDSKPPLKGY
jgi:benzoate membrane transport protein